MLVMRQSITPSLTRRLRLVQKHQSQLLDWQGTKGAGRRFPRAGEPSGLTGIMTPSAASNSRLGENLSKRPVLPEICAAQKFSQLDDESSTYRIPQQLCCGAARLHRQQRLFPENTLSRTVAGRARPTYLRGGTRFWPHGTPRPPGNAASLSVHGQHAHPHGDLRIMNAIRSIALALLPLAFATTVAADPRTVTLTVSFQNATVFDYVTGQNVASPFSGTASVSFSVDGPFTLTDYGIGSFVYYYGTNPPLNGAALTSSISGLTPQNVKDTATPYNSYAFQLNYDYPTDFIEQFGSRTDSAATNGGLYYTTSLSIYTGLWGWQDPRNGDGTSDFFYTADEVIDFLQSGVGKEAWFSQSYSVYAPIAGGGATYYDGKIWEDYGAVITSVTVSAVPEPSSIVLAGLGIILILRFRQVADHQKRTGAA